MDKSHKMFLIAAGADMTQLKSASRKITSPENSARTVESPSARADQISRPSVDVSKRAMQMIASTEMIESIRNGDYYAVNSLLQSKVSPNSTYGFFKEPLLMYACRYNNIEIAKLLLKNKADPAYSYAAPGSGSVLNHVQEHTLLLDAIDKKDIVMTRMLVHAKADVDHRDVNRNSPVVMRPIHNAMRSKEVEILKVLFKHTSHINKLYKLRKYDPMNPEDDTTPLLFAIESQSQDLVETVLQCKADVNQPNSKGMTPLLMAVITKMDDKIVRDAC